MIKNLIRIIAVALIAAGSMPPVSWAKEITYPIPSFTEAQLAQVRAWEQEWVGKRIDATNVDAVKDLLPETMYDFMKDPEKWGGIWFEIVPYQMYPFTPGRIKYTKQAEVKVGPNGELLDWVAGVPFPEPENGLQVAWNFDAWNRFDHSYRNPTGFLTDGRLKYDRVVAQRTWIQQFYGRLDTEPTPAFEKNPKHMLRAMFVDFTDPPEIKGQISFQVRYTDWYQPYDTWAYIPALRRIRRISAAQRMDTEDGTDFCKDDDSIWNGTITRNSYSLRGRKDMLVSRHQVMSKVEHTEGECLFSGLQRERVKVWVIDVQCNDPGYIYSRQVWYIDPELWKIVYGDKYDKYGRLWKVQEHMQTVVKGENGVEDADYFGSQGIDVQRMHSTNVLIPSTGSRMGFKGRPGFYSVNNLNKLGR